MKPQVTYTVFKATKPAPPAPSIESVFAVSGLVAFGVIGLIALIAGLDKSARRRVARARDWNFELQSHAGGRR